MKFKSLAYALSLLATVGCSKSEPERRDPSSFMSPNDKSTYTKPLTNEEIAAQAAERAAEESRLQASRERMLAKELERANKPDDDEILLRTTDKLSFSDAAKVSGKLLTLLGAKSYSMSTNDSEGMNSTVIKLKGITDATAASKKLVMFEITEVKPEERIINFRANAESIDQLVAAVTAEAKAAINSPKPGAIEFRAAPDLMPIDQLVMSKVKPDDLPVVVTLNAVGMTMRLPEGFEATRKLVFDVYEHKASQSSVTPVVSPKQDTTIFEAKIDDAALKQNGLKKIISSETNIGGHRAILQKYKSAVSSEGKCGWSLGILFGDATVVVSIQANLKDHAELEDGLDAALLSIKLGQ